MLRHSRKLKIKENRMKRAFKRNIFKMSIGKLLNDACKRNVAMERVTGDELSKEVLSFQSFNPTANAIFVLNPPPFSSYTRVIANVESP